VLRIFDGGGAQLAKKMDPNRRAMPKQEPFERIKNFDEVALGYTEKLAVDEASRCLGC
jgi:glutamate synthase (NADPH/NADH) small chain